MTINPEIVLELFLLLVIFGFGFYILRKIIPSKAVKQIRGDELREILEADTAILIDVRKQSAFAEFHIKGFKNIPLSQIKAATSELSDKNTEIVVMSQTGMGGNEACKKLKRQGFTNLTNIQGGMSSIDTN